MTRDSGTQSLRGLKTLVIVLGILVVLGTALVIGVVVKRMMVSTGGPAEQTVGQAASRPSGFEAPGEKPFATKLPGATGSHIAGITGAGGMVAIWVADDAGGRVIFVNPRDGRIAGSATLGR